MHLQPPIFLPFALSFSSSSLSCYVFFARVDIPNKQLFYGIVYGILLMFSFSWEFYCGDPGVEGGVGREMEGIYSPFYFSISLVFLFIACCVLGIVCL